MDKLPKVILGLLFLVLVAVIITSARKTESCREENMSLMRQLWQARHPSPEEVANAYEELNRDKYPKAWCQKDGESYIAYIATKTRNDQIQFWRVKIPPNEKGVVEKVEGVIIKNPLTETPTK